MTYTVHYRHKGFFNFKKTLKRVVGDGFIKESPYPTRFFLLENNTRVEVPCVDTSFEFSPERFTLLHKMMEQQAGQAIPLNPNP